MCTTTVLILDSFKIQIVYIREKVPICGTGIALLFSKGNFMNAKKLLGTMLVAMLLLTNSAFAETTHSDRESNYQTPRVDTRPCLKWFLFFCINRGGAYSAQTTRYQPMEPAMTQHIPDGGRRAPIKIPFKNAFDVCCPGGSYTNWGIWGDEKHKHRRSCHNSGSAIDVHAVKCNGSRAVAGTSRFGGFVSCMRSKGMHVIYGSGEHRNHAHISLKSCEVGKVGKIRLK